MRRRTLASWDQFLDNFENALWTVHDWRANGEEEADTVCRAQQTRLATNHPHFWQTKTTQQLWKEKWIRNSFLMNTNNANTHTHTHDDNQRKRPTKGRCSEIINPLERRRHNQCTIPKFVSTEQRRQNTFWKRLQVVEENNNNCFHSGHHLSFYLESYNFNIFYDLDKFCKVQVS